MRALKLVTGSQMAEIDRRTIEEGIPGGALMENAGRGVFEVVSEILEEVSGKSVTVICGRGNNGGDGFVVARLLKERSTNLYVFLLGRKEEVQGDALINLNRLTDLDLDVTEVVEEDQVVGIEQAVKRSSLMVDAIFGTGIRGPVRGIAAKVIEVINAEECPVVSVDLPSGLDADTGRFEGPCVLATATVTFGLPKVGHMLYPGRGHCGSLRLVDIGLSERAVQEIPCQTYLISQGQVAEVLPRRPPDVHKTQCGRLIVIAGSVGLTGAAVLTSHAAMRMGAGMVTLGGPESLNDVMEVKLTEVMTRPLPEVRKRRCLSLRALGEIKRMCEQADCLAIGPGLSSHHETSELVRRVLREVSIPLVVDADGLNALRGAPKIFHEVKSSVVVTPHPGEFSRLTGAPVAQIVADPIGTARRFSEAHKVTLVLKGASTVVAWSDGQVFVNSTGNAGMATAGAGDVLTGITAALVGQGVPPQEAAVAGVYLHGKAGDLARTARGEMGMVAGDLVDFLPEATQRVLKGT